MKFLALLAVLLLSISSISAVRQTPVATLEANSTAPVTQTTDAVANPEAKTEVEATTQAETSAKTETEVKTEAAPEAPLGFLVNTPPALPHAEPEMTTMEVLRNDGTTKTIKVHDSQYDMENNQACQADYLNNPVYQICKNLKCDECLNTVDCGFCGDGRCLPGNLEGAKCPGDCLNHWFFHDITKCPREINSGSFTNVAPEATKLINPELTEAKLKVTTTENPVVKISSEVITGQTVETATQTTLNPDGSIDEQAKTVSKPITSEMVRSAPTDVKTEETISSLATGERLDLPDAELKLHGQDQIADPATTGASVAPAE